MGWIGAIPFVDGLGDVGLDRGAGEMEMGVERLGDCPGQFAAGLEGVAGLGVVGWLAACHVIFKGGGIPSGKGEEMAAQGPEILVRACSEAGLADGGHDLGMPPCVEGFAIIDQPGDELGVEGLASMKKQRFDFRRSHVSAWASVRFRGSLAGLDGAVGFMGRAHGRGD